MSAAFDWQDFQAALHQAAAAAGFTDVALAETAAGRLVVWEKPGSGPRIYLSAGIHGDEPAGPMALLVLLQAGYFGDNAHWILCPALNPEGLAAATRENASQVDLNRDYWVRRSPEVLAHARWLDALITPDLFISLHEDWETTGFYFYEINLGDDQPARAGQILDAVRPWFPPEPGPAIDGHDSRGPGWIYHAADPDVPEGWPEAIYLAKKGCPLSFTFETPSHAALEKRVGAHVAAVQAACSNILPTRESN